MQKKTHVTWYKYLLGTLITVAVFFAGWQLIKAVIKKNSVTPQIDIITGGKYGGGDSTKRMRK